MYEKCSRVRPTLLKRDQLGEKTRRSDAGELDETMASHVLELLKGLGVKVEECAPTKH